MEEAGNATPLQSAIPHAPLTHRVLVQIAREAALAGTAFETEQKRQAEEKAAREREARIEHLTQMAAKRMGKKELAMGFGGWAEVWSEKVHQRTLLKQSSARLTKPKLVHSYGHWRQDWIAAAAVRAAAQAAVKVTQRLDAEAAKTQMAEAEVLEVRARAALIHAARLL